MQEVLLNSLYVCALLWLDDVLGYAKKDSVLDHMTVLKKLLQAMATALIKCNPDQCNLYTDVAKWTGHSIAPQGVAYDDSFIQGLIHMTPPKRADELQQFLENRTSGPTFSLDGEHRVQSVPR
uniref:Reverse transcriptase domain-containing protein n=1 Tax=Spongospora subterranea TaxID=70186 RepID=A0A0H5QZZ2_9EUKA|eukprot:CRZ07262.1 hypothetical protein [Spongospora subterranea]